MKCDKCANYLKGLDRCKFCSYERSDDGFDGLRHLIKEIEMCDGWSHYTIMGEKEMSDNIFTIKYDNVTVNGVKAKSFTMNSSDGEIAVEWKEDFDLRKLIEEKGVNNGVNKRLDRFDVNYVGCFFDRNVSVLYIRTDDISTANKHKVADCFDIYTYDIAILYDDRHILFDEWGGKGWFAVKVSE